MEKKESEIHARIATSLKIGVCAEALKQDRSISWIVSKALEQYLKKGK